MDDLLATAAGTVFLETAERIVLDETAADALPQILADTRLRPSAQLWLLRGDFSGPFYDFVAAQESEATVGTPERLPLILEESGRYRLA